MKIVIDTSVAHKSNVYGSLASDGGLVIVTTQALLDGRCLHTFTHHLPSKLNKGFVGETIVYQSIDNEPTGACVVDFGAVRVFNGLVFPKERSPGYDRLYWAMQRKH